MSMYEIVREMDGTYTVLCTIQDEIIRRTANTLPAARTWLKGAALSYNNQVIDAKDIHFGVRKSMATTVVEWKS